MRGAVTPDILRVLALRGRTIVEANEALFPKCAQARKAYMANIDFAAEHILCTSGLNLLRNRTYEEWNANLFRVPGMPEAVTALGLIATKWSVQIINHMEKNGSRNDEGREVEPLTVPEDFHLSFSHEKDALLAAVDAYFSEWITLHNRCQAGAENAPPNAIPRETAIKLFYTDPAPDHGSEPQELPHNFVQAKRIIRAALFDAPVDIDNVGDDNEELQHEMLSICSGILAPNAARMVLGRNVSQEVLQAVTPLKEIAARSHRQPGSRSEIQSAADLLILRTSRLNPRITLRAAAARPD